MELIPDLRKLLNEQSVKFGDFTLRSGKKSDFYIDCRPVILSNYGVNLAAMALGRLSVSFECLAATGVGGSYIACSMGNLFCKSVIHIREEKKDHGSKNQVELPYDFNSKWKVVIVDDVLTTGSSLKLCIESLMEKDIKIFCCSVLVDREEGGRETIENTYKIPVRSLFIKSDFKE